MVLAIHQPNYFPWLGYLDKMAKADKYIVLDEVQLTDRSFMMRNQFLEKNGNVCMLGLSLQKKGYREKYTREIELLDIKKTQQKHKRFIEMNYGKMKGFPDVWNEIEFIFEREYRYLIDIDVDTMKALRKLYDINTEMIFQSEIDYDRKAKKNDLMLNLSEVMHTDVYLSGQGAKAYMDDCSFENKGIKVWYQQFQFPTYTQVNTNKFIPGLSAVDMVMQLGVNEARQVFWDNVERGRN